MFQGSPTSCAPKNVSGAPPANIYQRCVRGPPNRAPQKILQGSLPQIYTRNVSGVPQIVRPTKWFRGPSRKYTLSRLFLHPSTGILLGSPYIKNRKRFHTACCWLTGGWWVSSSSCSPFGSCYETRGVAMLLFWKGGWVHVCVFGGIVLHAKYITAKKA